MSRAGDMAGGNLAGVPGNLGKGAEESRMQRSVKNTRRCEHTQKEGGSRVFGQPAE